MTTLRAATSSVFEPLAPAPAPSIDDVPLVVDVDGTLLRGDILLDGLVQLCTREPARLPGLVRAALGGRAPLKAFVARSACAPAMTLPLRASTLALIERARAAGQPVVLASGAHESHLGALAERVGATRTFGSTHDENLTGARKLARLRERYAQFDYVGDSRVDLPLWRAARRAYVVNAPAPTRWLARRARADLVELREEDAPRLPLLRALRPHQWAKNALVVVPALAAHLSPTPALLLQLFLGFAAFSALASAVYLLNDVVDLPHDRVHRTKRNRPIAAGHLSLPGTLAAAAGLVTLAVALCLVLPLRFGLVLAGYLLATSAYSLHLKRIPLVDVFTLALLYASRILAGGAVVDVHLSSWLLAFSIFFFLSLALAKRVVELRDRPSDATESARGYRASDLPLLSALGIAAATASSLVFCLYIADPTVIDRYRRPEMLWVGLPALMYWQARVWLWTERGWMHEDPVVFALRDRKSHLLGALFILLMVLAR